jgi:hypothetical protein
MRPWTSAKTAILMLSDRASSRALPVLGANAAQTRASAIAISSWRARARTIGFPQQNRLTLARAEYSPARRPLNHFPIADPGVCRLILRGSARRYARIIPPTTTNSTGEPNVYSGHEARPEGLEPPTLGFEVGRHNRASRNRFPDLRREGSSEVLPGVLKRLHRSAPKV